MKLACLILFICTVAQAADNRYYNALIESQMINGTSGGGAPTGPPLGMKTTTATGTANPATVTVSANSSAANSIDVVQISFFNQQTISSVGNGSQTAALITNYIADAAANLTGAVYVFTNPPTASRTISITFATAPDTGWIIDVATVTNCSAGFGNFYTNGAATVTPCTSGTGNGMSKTVSSAANELILGFTTLGYCTTHASPVSATLGASQTEVVKTELGTIDNWQNLVWSASGSASVSTSSQYTVDGGPQGACIVCIKGF